MKSILLAILVLIGTSDVFAWTLNDVSVLLPLPKQSQLPLLLTPQSAGARGVLLPVEIYKKLPVIIRNDNPTKYYEQYLKVIAVRFDPCFIEKASPVGCRRQIRLVWQPIATSGSNVFAMDAAIHTFYDLSAEDWGALLSALRPIAGTQVGESLDIHPRILKEGLTGKTWTQIKASVLNYAGEKNLTRATAMTVDVFNSLWTFTGFDIEGGNISPIEIPKTKAASQIFLLDLTHLYEFTATVDPMPADERNWNSFVLDSLKSKQTMSEAELRSVFDRALRIENPLREDTSSTDCVSCHIAQTVRLWGERSTGFNWSQDFSSVLYKSAFSLKNNSVEPTPVNHLRAFGYFLEDPIISQRLINESAEVLKSIQQSESSKQKEDFHE